MAIETSPASPRQPLHPLTTIQNIHKAKITQHRDGNKNRGKSITLAKNKAKRQTLAKNRAKAETFNYLAELKTKKKRTTLQHQRRFLHWMQKLQEEMQLNKKEKLESLSIESHTSVTVTSSLNISSCNHKSLRLTHQN